MIYVTAAATCFLTAGILFGAAVGVLATQTQDEKRNNSHNVAGW